MTVYKQPNRVTYDYDFRFKGRRYAGNTQQRVKDKARAYELTLKERLQAEHAASVLKSVTSPDVSSTSFQIGGRREPGAFRVYFARCADSIKIGVARNVDARIRRLQVSNPAPIIVLAVISGGYKVERQVHERFREIRLSGEWFRATPELLDFISEAGRREAEKTEHRRHARQPESIGAVIGTGP